MEMAVIAIESAQSATTVDSAVISAFVDGVKATYNIDRSAFLKAAKDNMNLCRQGNPRRALGVRVNAGAVSSSSLPSLRAPELWGEGEVLG